MSNFQDNHDFAEQMRQTIFPGALAALCLLLAAPIGAQVTGTISGTVEDATQAGVSGATVTVLAASASSPPVRTAHSGSRRFPSARSRWKWKRPGSRK